MLAFIIWFNLVHVFFPETERYNWPSLLFLSGSMWWHLICKVQFPFHFLEMTGGKSLYICRPRQKASGRTGKSLQLVLSLMSNNMLQFIFDILLLFNWMSTVLWYAWFAFSNYNNTILIIHINRCVNNNCFIFCSMMVIVLLRDITKVCI